MPEVSRMYQWDMGHCSALIKVRALALKKTTFILGLQGPMKVITGQSKQSININALSTRPAYSPLFLFPEVSGALL